MQDMLEVFAKSALSYLLGSIMGGLLLGRLRGVDIRETGSGNAGATNALRTQGKAFAIAVLIVDAIKGALAAAVIPAIPWPLPVGTADPSILGVTCASAAVLGHIYPLFYGFRGGKGAATLAGAAAFVIPAVMPVVLAVWVAGIVISGYVGVSTVLAAVAAPVFLLLFDPAAFASPAGAFAVAMALLILYTHRGNITRMLRGEENRFESAMLFRRLRR